MKRVLILFAAALCMLIPSMAARPSAADAATAVASTACLPPLTAQNMSDPAYYNFVQTYNSACSSKQNWNRQFDDITLSTTLNGNERLSLTTSTALGGAIASIKLNNKEFIDSGGHGSAVQRTFHAWQDGSVASECYNPTQAGSRPDDRGPAPFHGSSTSALYNFHATSPTALETGSRPAMYVPLGNTGYEDCRADTYQEPRSPFTYGLSPYWLDTQIKLATDNGLNLDNVIKVDAQVYSEDNLYDNFDSVFITYLQRDFTAAYEYDLDQARLIARAQGAPGTHNPLLRCTADGVYCLGMYFPRSTQSGAYYYGMSNPPSAFNGMSGEQTMQITSPTRSIGAGSALKYETYLVAGNRSQVISALKQLHRARP